MRGVDGTVTSIVANRYTVKCGNKEYTAYARGKLRRDGDIYVGDKVAVVFERGEAVIDAVKPRTNSLVRPYVANVDAALIVIAKEPEPDMLLVDKIIVNCYVEGIKPVICYNKCELAGEGEIAKLLEPYRSFMDCIEVSAEEKRGFGDLAAFVEGKTVCLAGQSAVGKTSLLNALLDLNLKTDGLSRKVKRGKNTTRHVEIYEALGGNIMDTCGFSMLTLVDLKPEELTYYYEDFIKYQDECRYRGCTHTEEPDCAVKKAVAEEALDKGRYMRYLEIYGELKENRRKLYD